MANVTPDKIVISPAFVPPPGSEDIFTQKGDLATQVQPDFVDDSTTAMEDEGLEYANVVESDTDGETIMLETPTFVIFDQKIVRGPGGQNVIDVILQIEDVVGAIDYEVQVARI